MPAESNLAVVLRRENDLRVESIPYPHDIKPNEVLLETRWCGICGTDIHLWEEGRLGDFVLKEPLVLGHEISAVVVQVGSRVTNLRPGDRVTMEPAIPCLECSFCRLGKYNLCDVCNNQARGLPPTDGALRKYFTHPAAFCYKLANTLSMEEGAFTEPLSCVIHGVNRAKVKIGQDVLITGAGTIGLLSVLVAKAYGAARVCIASRSKEKLDFAKKLGADSVVLIEKDHSPEKVSNLVEACFGGKKADTTLECTGYQFNVQSAIHGTMNGGRVALVGFGQESIEIPLVKTSNREVDLIGVCRFRNCFPLAVHLLNSGKVNVKPLITHKFNISEALEAFKTLKEGKGIKVMIEF